MKIIINGLGRIGKLVFRRLCDKDLYKNILLVNEKEGSPEDQEYFLKYDTVHGSWGCLLYTSPSPRDPKISRMPSSA